MDVDYLLNRITLKDHRKFMGIIDFSTSKQLFFFDFSNDCYVDYLMIVMLWRGNSPHMRFSVFCAVNYPELTLPNVILLPQNNIEEILGRYDTYEKPKQRKRIIKPSL